MPPANKKEVGEILEEQFGVKLHKRVSSEMHILTHQHIDATFWLIEEEIKGKEYVKTNLTEINAYPLPRLIERFIENHPDLF